MNEERIETLVAKAEEAVETLEELGVGKPFSPAVQEARQAIADLGDRARKELFPAGPVPVGADLVADLEFFTEGFRAGSYIRHVSALHAEALSSYPALARLLRGAVVRRRIQNAAEAHADSHNLDRSEYAAQALATFERTVAGHLQTAGEGPAPWSEVLAVTLPELKERIDMAVARHQDHRQGEASARNARTAARRALIAERLDRLPQFASVQIPGESRRRKVRELASLLPNGRFDRHLDELEAQVEEMEADLPQRARAKQRAS